MENRIIFLGTAGDSIVAGKQIRGSGGIIIKIGETQLHIDPGPGSTVRTVQNQVNVRANTTVISTNNSIIHSNDINAVIDAMTYGGLDKNGILVTTDSITNGLENKNPIVTEFHKSCVEKIIIMKPGQRIAIEETEIHGTIANSKDPTSFGLKILAPDFTLGYTSDTKYSKEVAEEYKDCDIIIMNICDPKSDERIEYNLNTEDAIKIIKKTNPKLAILTHFSYRMLKADPLNEVRNIQRETGIEVIMAKDGLTVDPTAYSANSKQKRLSGFTKKEDTDSNNKTENNNKEESNKNNQEEQDKNNEEENHNDETEKNKQETESKNNN